MEIIDVARQAAPFLETWLGVQAEFAAVPGAQVAVRVGDELCASFAVGAANALTGEPLTTKHLFHIASHSKTFTATAVMQMVERGRLRLDDQAVVWIPELAGSPAAEYTVRELLGHQAGINRDGADGDHWQLLKDFPDRDELLACARQDAVLEANTYFKYSNIGYSLLGLVIEAASGQPYDEYVIDHVVEPLGLRRTGPELPRKRRKQLAGAHAARPAAGDPIQLVPHISSRAEAPATGFYSTAEEVSRFMVAHTLGRDELLSDASKRLMQRRESRITRGGERFYGLGMQSREVNGRLLVGHSGGWPGQLSQTWLDPQTGLCVSVLANSLEAPVGAWATAIVQLLDMVLAAEKAGPAEWPTGIAPESFVGDYAALWGREFVVLLGSRLYQVPARTPSPHEAATALEVVDADTLRTPAEDSYAATGEDIVFTRTPKGRVKSMRSDALTMWPTTTYRKRVAKAQANRAVDS